MTRRRILAWRWVLVVEMVTLLPLLGAVLAVLTRPGAGVPTWVNPPSTGTSRYPMQSDALTLPRPDRVRIAAIGVDSPLEYLSLDAAGALRPPVDYARAGWYQGGPAPGDMGPAVIAGHVDSKTGPAVFYRLHAVRPGDTIEISRGGTWLAFRVVSVEQRPKQNFPSNQVYRPTPLPELRLITCGGSFDWRRRSYADNIIVSAVG